MSGATFRRDPFVEAVGFQEEVRMKRKRRNDLPEFKAEAAL